jgi:hypothetical protein
MKCVIIILLAICSISLTPAQAQPKSAREARLHADRMNERLKLSPEQYKKVVEINMAAARKAKLAAETSADQQVMKRRMREISDDIDIALLEILSTLQWRDWIDLSGELHDDITPDQVAQ